jgi:hypothetical protein
MSRNVRTRRKPLGFDALEGRALLSVAQLNPPHAPGTAILAHESGPQRSFHARRGQAVINALLGGAGHEFVALALREMKDPLVVLRALDHGTLTQYPVPGLVVKRINFQIGYTGLPHDTLALSTGGAVVLKNRKIELGAIVRGPFTTSPLPTTIVFAINRGAGHRLGPHFAGRPGITPDALVSVTVGPHGQNHSATITDLTTSVTHRIDSPEISVAGPTVRVLLDVHQLPSEGLKLQHYTFAVWTATTPNAPIQEVGSFIPEDSMARFGIEPRVRPTL